MANKIAWKVLKMIGDAGYRYSTKNLPFSYIGLRLYYFCLRAMCNWLELDWYGRNTEKAFSKVWER